MAAWLFVALLAAYIVMGITVTRYTWRVRAFMGILTFVVPAWVYFFF